MCSSSKKPKRSRTQQQQERRERQRAEAAVSGERPAFSQQDVDRKKRNQEAEWRAAGRPWRANGSCYTLPPEVMTAMADVKREYERRRDGSAEPTFCPPDFPPTIAAWLDAGNSIDAIDPELEQPLLHHATSLYFCGWKVVAELLRRGANVRGNPAFMPSSPLFDVLSDWIPWGVLGGVDWEDDRWQVVRLLADAGARCVYAVAAARTIVQRCEEQHISSKLRPNTERVARMMCALGEHDMEEEAIAACMQSMQQPYGHPRIESLGDLTDEVLRDMCATPAEDFKLGYNPYAD